MLLNSDDLYNLIKSDSPLFISLCESYSIKPDEDMAMYAAEKSSLVILAYLLNRSDVSVNKRDLCVKLMTSSNHDASITWMKDNIARCHYENLVHVINAYC